MKPTWKAALATALLTSGAALAQPAQGPGGGSDGNDPAKQETREQSGAREGEPSAPAQDTPLPAAADPAPTDWTAYGRDNAATRYSPLDRITRDNVKKLKKAWTYRTGDLPKDMKKNKWAPETTPLKVGEALYLCTATNELISLDAGSGRERWRYDPKVSEDAIPYSASCRGVAYHEAPDLDEGAACKRRIIEGTLDARLIAVDADTGRPCEGFGNHGEVDLTDGMGEVIPGYVAVTSPPTIVRGVAVVGHQVLDGQKEDSPSGVIRGYDVMTGQLAWAWDMGRPGETGLPPEGETYTRGTPNAWTTFSGDEELGLVYVPMGNSAVDYYSANRSEAENKYSTSLVALDATSGEVRWSFQTIHKDVWDYDLGSQSTLVDFPTESGPVPAVILPTKVGDIYVLDRRTGEPLTEVEERPVPQSDLPGENLSETQPFSVGMPSLARKELTGKNTWGITPLDHLWCRIKFHRANYEGIYTPPSMDKPLIEYPGYNGGNDWGGASVDPERDILIANYNNVPMYDQLISRKQATEMGLVPLGQPGGSSESGGPVPQAGAPYGVKIFPWRIFTGALCNLPPFGGIMAIDMETREVLWDRPLGTAWNNGPFNIPSRLPLTIGTPNNGGSVITAGGLIFIAATTDDLIRAIDIETGETLWEDRLPAGGQATPMTYEANGRQYLVMMAGGHHFMETEIGDYLVAYALPAPDEAASDRDTSKKDSD